MASRPPILYETASGTATALGGYATGIGVGKILRPPVVSNVAIKDTFWPPLADPDQDDYHQFHFAAILGFSL